MAAHSSVLAWRTPSTEEPGRLQGEVIESQILLGKQQIFIYLYFGVLNILKADFTTFCMLIVIPALYVVLILCQALLKILHLILTMLMSQEFLIPFWS